LPHIIARRWADGWRDQDKKQHRELRLVKQTLRAENSGPIRRKDSITEPLETFYALRARIEFRESKVKRNLR
jgi:hypothetical protein